MVNDWRELSVLIAGCGSIGKRHAQVLHGLDVRDIRACDPSEAQRNSLSAQTPVRLYDSFGRALNDEPDIALIGTPPRLHIPMAVQAIEAGCHVLIEKPLSDSTEGIDELAALAASKQKKVMVALCFRYHEGLRRAKEYFEGGRIGRLVSIRALMGEHLPTVRPDYRELFTSKYLGALDLTHEIDLAVWFAGQPVRRVAGLKGAYSDIGIEAPDVAEILIEFENCLASIHLDFFQQPRRRQLELLGTRGTILVEFARWERCRVSIYETSTEEWRHEDLTTERNAMFRAEDEEFLRAVAEDRPIACDIAAARPAVEVVAALTDNGHV